MIGSRHLNYQKTHKNIFVKEKTKSSEIEDSVEKFYCQRWNLVTETSLCRTRFKLGEKKKNEEGLLKPEHCTYLCPILRKGESLNVVD